MNHPTIDRLNARLEGTLSERDRAEFDSHLAKCPACRARLSESSARVPAPQPSRHADRSVATPTTPMSPVMARVRRRRPLWGRVFTGSGFSAAANVTVFVLILGLVWTRIDNSLGPRAAREQAAADEFVPDWAAPSPDFALADAPPAAGTTIRARTGLRTTATMSPAASAVLERDLPGRPGLRRAMADASGSPPRASGAWHQMSQLDGGVPEEPAPQEAEAPSDVIPDVSGTSFPPISFPTPAGEKPRARTRSEIVPACGTLSDPRGDPIAGAHVVALGSDARSARSGADGRFCFATLRVGDTLSVWRAGFQPIRVTLDSETLLSLRMQPISTPTPEAAGR